MEGRCICQNVDIMFICFTYKYWSQSKTTSPSIRLSISNGNSPKKQHARVQSCVTPHTTRAKGLPSKSITCLRACNKNLMQRSKSFSRTLYDNRKFKNHFEALWIEQEDGDNVGCTLKSMPY